MRVVCVPPRGRAPNHCDQRRCNSRRSLVKAHNCRGRLPFRKPAPTDKRARPLEHGASSGIKHPARQSAPPAG